MPAYFVAEVEITNPGPYETYRAGVPATLAQYGGRFVARAAPPSWSRAAPSRTAS